MENEEIQGNSGYPQTICDENSASMHNYKHLEIPILIIWSIVTREGKQIIAWDWPRFYSYL